MSNILITGGLGFVGFSLAHHFNKYKNKIFIIDKKKNFLKKSKFEVFTFNCNDISKLKKIVIKKSIDTIIHCAADIDIISGEKNKKKYFENNYNLTKKIVKIINSTSCKYLIFSSTAAIYGNKRKKISENSKKKPLNIYGLSKLKSENYIRKNLLPSKKYSILRYFNVVGSYKKLSGVVNKNINPLFKVISKNIILNKKKIKIFGKNFQTKDGTAIRDYIHIEDLTDFHFQIFKKLKKEKKNLILNLGYGNGFSNLEVVNTFEKVVGCDIQIQYVEKRKGEVPISICNNKKLKKIIKYFPKKNNLKAMIKDSFNWFDQQY